MNKTVQYDDKNTSFYDQKELVRRFCVVCLKAWFCVYVIRCQVAKRVFAFFISKKKVKTYFFDFFQSDILLFQLLNKMMTFLEITLNKTVYMF